VCVCVCMWCVCVSLCVCVCVCVILNNMGSVRLSCDIVARSRNSHCYDGNATYPSVCIAEPRVIVSKLQILIIAQQCFYGEMKSTQVFM